MKTKILAWLMMVLVFSCKISGQEVPGTEKNDIYEKAFFANQENSKEDIIIGLDTVIATLEMATGDNILMPQLVGTMMSSLLPMTSCGFQALLDIAKENGFLTKKEIQVYVEKYTGLYNEISEMKEQPEQ